MNEQEIPEVYRTIIQELREVKQLLNSLLLPRLRRNIVAPEKTAKRESAPTQKTATKREQPKPAV